MSQDTLYSTHIFLFPFKWEIKSNQKIDQIKRFEELLLGDLNRLTPGWFTHTFQLDYISQYNEYTYFYDYVREILYDVDSTPLDPNLQGKANFKQLLKHYEFNFSEEASYEIKVANRNLPYTLDIGSLTLNLYEMGVGVITFFLKNTHASQSSPKDILKINQYGRRIYPPFLALPTSEIGKSYDMGKEEEYWKEGVTISQNIELAEHIWIRPKKESEPFTELKQNFREDFSSYKKKKKLKHGPFLLPNFIQGLFFNTSQQPKTQEPEHLKANSDSVLIKPVLDDRMFVVSWYGGIGELQKNARKGYLGKPIEEGEELKDPPFYKHKDFRKIGNYWGHFWYQFLFVDSSGPSLEDSLMASRQLDKHTYWRWAPSTYYGICRYSMVTLTDELKQLGPMAVLAQHVESIYYKMAELVLVQRACILKFADEVTHLSYFAREHSPNDTKTYEELTYKVTTLYENFLRFTNKVYFREVTAQEQGIEMYNMLQEHMNLDAQVKDLKADIEQLHTYIHLLKDKQDKEREEATTNKLNAITILGSFLLLPSFVLTMYSLEQYEPSKSDHPFTHYLVIISGLLILGGISWLLVDRIGERAMDIPKEEKIQRRIWLLRRVPTWAVIMLVFLLLVVMILLPFIFQQLNLS